MLFCFVLVHSRDAVIRHGKHCREQEGWDLGEALVTTVLTTRNIILNCVVVIGVVVYSGHRAIHRNWTSPTNRALAPRRPLDFIVVSRRSFGRVVVFFLVVVVSDLRNWFGVIVVDWTLLQLGESALNVDCERAGE